MDTFNSFVRNWSICAIAIFALAFSSLRAEDSSSGAVSIEPSKIKVLLLPALDESGRRSPLYVQIVRLRQQYQFINRHFVVLGEGMAAQAAQKDPGLKIDSSSDRSAKALDELGARTGADWVVSLAVQKVDYEDDPFFDGTHFKGYTTLKLQVRDARRRTWLTNREHTSRATGGGAPPEILLISIWNAAEEALATVLSRYPEVVPVSQDGAIVDYLKGQTEPFIGEPGKSFSGLTPPVPFRQSP
jgi:hypothetical protein